MFKQGWKQIRQECNGNSAFLAVIPGLIVMGGWWLRQALLPYYVNYHDPEYAYLFNGAGIANLVAPDHIDHPGTPLQVLIAIILRLMHPLTSAEEMTLLLAEDPERYLVLANGIMLLLLAAAVWWAGRLIFRITGSLGIAFLAQWTPFIFVPVVFSLARVTPEPMLLGMTLIFGAVLVQHCWSPALADTRRHVAAFGVLYGIGVTVKLTFVPVAMVPLMVLDSWAERRRFVKFAIIAFFVSTLPWWLKFPLFKLYRRFFHWIFDLFTGSGIYGSGSRTVIHWNSFVANLEQIVIQHTTYIFLVSIVLLVSGWAAIRALRRRERLSKTTRALIALSAVHVMTVLIFAKHFQSDRYLIVALALAGITIVITYRQLEKLWQPPPVLAAAVPVLTGVILVMLTWLAVEPLDSWRNANKERRASLVQVEQFVHEKYRHCAQVHQDSSEKEFAVFFGLQWARPSSGMKNGRDRYFSGHPFFIYDPGAKQYLGPDETEVTLEHIKTTAPCVILWTPTGVIAL